MKRQRRWLLSAILFWGLTARMWAGGSGLNVAVVVNQTSTNSVQLGNYYCEQRQVPPQNLLRINWPGGNTDWTTTDFNTYLVNPLLAMLASRRPAQCELLRQQLNRFACRGKATRQERA